jgi:hypothetical protein
MDDSLYQDKNLVKPTLAATTKHEQKRVCRSLLEENKICANISHFSPEEIKSRFDSEHVDFFFFVKII